MTKFPTLQLRADNKPKYYDPFYYAYTQRSCRSWWPLEPSL